MSTGVSSDPVAADAETQDKEESVRLLQQKMKETDARLVDLSAKINLCHSLIDDLVAVKRVLVNKSLHDVSLSQKPTKE